MEKNNLSTNQEIDLIYLLKKIKSMFDSLGFFIFKSIRFFIKNIFIFIGLIILGLLISVVLEKTLQKSFRSDIVVVPNFNSTEYLYSISKNYKNLTTKNDKEKKLLNNIIRIEVTPILDINSYFNNSKNRDFFKTLSESGVKFEDFIKKEEFKNFNTSFLITISTTDEKYSKESIDFLLNKLNNSSYYLKKQKIEIDNLKENRIQLTKSIEQINLILNNLGSNNFDNTKGQLNVNTYQSLNDVINLKSQYVDDILMIDNKLITSSKIIFPIDITYNKEFKEKLYYNTKIIYPLILVSIFIIFNLFKRFYNKYNRLELKK
ncbi:hypothetical protein [Chishuiella sp.]|uniref:hypothetical protein n=1 Tax=Chishuiella sp. TaxID=1969467 RepID=UPI0028AA6D49|nr:hypothetical protein [Chishuiella sp.]